MTTRVPRVWCISPRRKTLLFSGQQQSWTLPARLPQHKAQAGAMRNICWDWQARCVSWDKTIHMYSPSNGICWPSAITRPPLINHREMHASEVLRDSTWQPCLNNWPNSQPLPPANPGITARANAGSVKFRSAGRTLVPQCRRIGTVMTITINNELLQYIDPLTANEYAALERSLQAEGCRDALVLWGDILVDGHNRYEICRKHGIEFKTVQNTAFKSIDDVMLWMIDNQLGRRSVTDFQRGVLALRKRDIIAARVKAEMDASIESASAYAPIDDGAAKSTDEPGIPSASIKTREDIARVAGISSNTVGQIEKIRKTAAPELVEAVRAGTISISAAAAVASLPSDEQINAVAGSKKELRQAAKMVREQQAANRTPRTPPAPRAQSEDGEADNDAPFSGSSPVGSNDPVALRAEIAALHARITALTAENQALQAEVDALRGVAA